jgi:hypothetical protein
MWNFHQATGEITHVITGGVLLAEVMDPKPTSVCFAYSGNGVGKNNPAMQQVPCIGPIPRGRYRILKPAFDSPTHGPVVMRLEAFPGTNTFSRSGFLIHGDSKRDPGNASLGCIVATRWARELIAENEDDILEVV